METLEERIERLEFYQRILMKMVKSNEFPFFQIVIEKALTEQEMIEVFSLCEELEKQLEEQREDGFIHYTSLLVHFVGMLNSKLDPLRTIKALSQQNLYNSLMEKLEELIQKEDHI
ncbi:DUF1878 family protein [Anaerobacillus sp. MEB173]|uniref:DUF1878 family protein n=1 Tax=Anaerobacillus sp. MEB173 TaxID=3383345 RepID=UPI003F909678